MRHHCTMIDAAGKRLRSRRTLNDEAVLTGLIVDVLAQDADVRRAVDIDHGGAPPLIGLLLDRGQPMVCISGLAVHRVADGCRGVDKSDAKDAFVIVDQARMRNPLGPLGPGGEVAVDLRTLTNRCAGLAQDRTRSAAILARTGVKAADA